MFRINRNLNQPGQENTLTSDTVKNDSEFVDSCAGVLPRDSALNTTLVEVKNVCKKLDSVVVNDSSPLEKGIFIKQGTAVVSPAEIIATQAERPQVDEKRIHDIINILLPKADTSYQLARTTYENRDIKDSLATENIENICRTTLKQKQSLQSEAISLFTQRSTPATAVASGDNTEQQPIDNMHPLFTLIFYLSFSHEDVNFLLNSSGTTAHFLNFANEDCNREKVSNLYRALNENSSRSLDNEMVQVLKTM